MFKAHNSVALATRLKRTLLVVLSASLVALALWINATTTEKGEKTVPKKSDLESGHVEVSGRSIHYMSGGAPDRPVVMMVHGSPGNWTAFEDFMTDRELLSRFHLISVDRPGFGQSGFGMPVASLKQQAYLLGPLLDFSGGEGAILIGHSLGGAVVARLAMDYPKRVVGMLMVAPSIDPELEKLRWYNRLAALSVVSTWLPIALNTSNREILSLQRELTSMRPLWGQLRVRTIVIQGLRDKLVHPGNADFAERVLNPPARIVRLPEAGHFVLWEQPRLIKQLLLELAEEVWGRTLIMG